MIKSDLKIRYFSNSTLNKNGMKTLKSLKKDTDQVRPLNIYIIKHDNTD